MNASHSNPFEPPRQISSQKEPFAWSYLFSSVLWCGLAIKMMVARPIMASMFEEFGLALPKVTIWLLHPLATVAVVTIAVLVVIAGGLIAQTGKERRMLGRWTAASGILAWVTIVIGFGLPLYQLINALAS